MQEQIVSYKIAKLAESKGFDKYTLSFYHIESKQLCNYDIGRLGSYDSYSDNPLPFDIDEILRAPTYDSIHKFIRDERGVLIQIYNNGSGYLFQMSKIGTGTDLGYSEHIGPNNSGCWDTYEEALEFAIYLQLSYDLVKGKHWGLYVKSAFNNLKKVK